MEQSRFPLWRLWSRKRLLRLAVDALLIFFLVFGATLAAKRIDFPMVDAHGRAFIP